MQQILVPLDGSTLAERALPYARTLAPLLHAELRLLRVVSAAEHNRALLTDPLMTREVGLTPENMLKRDTEVWDTLRLRAETYLGGQASTLREAGVRVTTEVVVDRPAEAIIEAARHPGTLIVMATHGYGGLRRWALGSVADKVLQAAPAPILLVRAATPIPEKIGLHRVVVPLDGSELSLKAMPMARELAERTNAHLLVLQAVSPLLESYVQIPPTQRPDLRYPDMMEATCSQAEAGLRALVRHYSEGVPVEAVALAGDPAEVIVETATNRHADLIVMATHGYGGLRRWALGSVADKVLHAAKTPLLLVRAA